MKDRFKPFLVVILGLVLLGGCATRPPVEQKADESLWRAHRASLETLSDWQVQGRVAIRRDDEGWTASFDWRQRQNNYRIRLRGPFGQGGIELHGDDQGVWMRRGEQSPVFAQSVEELLAREIGWRLPVLGLVDWMRGLPVESQPASSLEWDGQGRLQTLEQDGWRIAYQRYQELGDLQLPGKVKLIREPLHVKLVVDTWQIP